MPVALETAGLEKHSGGIAAVNGLSLSIERGARHALIGPNGAGKTTFVNMITGHIKPSRGSIRFEGRDITALPSRAITRLGISRSFQVAQIFPSLTVFENMCAAAAIARGPHGMWARATTPLHAPATVAEAEAAIELFRIAAYRDARSATLPQGVRKLLDIAMATVGAPRVLLLDEPTSGVSAEEKFGIMEMVLKAVRAEGTTVLFVEHDMEVVGRFAQRVLAFYDGRIIADAAPQVALADPEVKRYVVGRHA